VCRNRNKNELMWEAIIKSCMISISAMVKKKTKERVRRLQVI